MNKKRKILLIGSAIALLCVSVGAFLYMSHKSIDGVGESSKSTGNPPFESDPEAISLYNMAHNKISDASFHVKARLEVSGETFEAWRTSYIWKYVMDGETRYSSHIWSVYDDNGQFIFDVGARNDYFVDLVYKSDLLLKMNKDTLFYYGWDPTGYANVKLINSKECVKYVVFNKDYLPVEVFLGSKQVKERIKFEYLPFGANDQLDIITPPAGSLVRFVSEAEMKREKTWKGQYEPQEIEEAVKPKQAYLLVNNFIGKVGNRMLSMYLSSTDRGKVTALVYPVGEYDFINNERYNGASKPDIYEIYNRYLYGTLSKSNIKLSDLDDNLVFSGTLSDQSLQGDWVDENGTTQKVKLKRPQEAVDFYLEAWDKEAKNNRMSIKFDGVNEDLDAFNNYLFRQQAGLESSGECQSSNFQTIYCNESGILSLSLSSCSYCEGAPKGYCDNSYVTMDLVTGHVLEAKDMLQDNYFEILRDLGYEFEERSRVAVFPNGLLFIGIGAIAIQAPEYFISYKQLKDVVRPYGPLHPFLAKNNLVPASISMPKLNHSGLDMQLLYNGCAKLKIGEQWVYYNKNGDPIIAGQEENTTLSEFGKYFKVDTDGSQGIITTEGKELVPKAYQSIRYVRDQVCVVGNDKKYGLFNVASSKEITPLKYDEIWPFDENGVAKVFVNKKEGFIDMKGFEVVSPIYYSAYFDNGSYRLTNDDKKKGLADKSGKIILPVKFDDISKPSEGRIIVRLNGKDGIADEIGKVYEVWYKSIGSFTQGMAMVSDEKCGYIDKEGKLVVPMKYDKAYNFSEGRAAVCINKKWGFIDATGQEICPPTYDDVREFNNGFAAVQKGKLWGFVNTKGEECIQPTYESATRFYEGLASVSKDGKCGFINSKGEVVIPFKYSSCQSFESGLAWVYDQNNISLYVDKTGKEYKSKKEYRDKK